MHGRLPSAISVIPAFAVVAVTSILSAAALANPSGPAQVCSLVSADVGQQGTVLCLDAWTGATTQSVPVGNIVSAAGSVGGNLSRYGDRVLVTNQAGGAVLLQEDHGRLVSPSLLDTDGEGSLSGTLSRRGAYVLTATRLLFFPGGKVTATSEERLRLGDGSASQVALAGGYAYVAEKNGSLEAFQLGRNGNITGPATPVAGVPPGVIVGITGYEDLVVAPVAHLASNPGQATVPVVSALEQVQLVPTKEVAACWTANDDGEVCVSNPGSMTVSCGRLGAAGFRSYTSAAANPVGDAVFDLAVRGGLVGIQGTLSGAPVLLTFRFADDNGDFLAPIGAFPTGTPRATGALLLPPNR